VWIIGFILFLVFLGSFAVTGIQILTDPNCAAVSFGGRGGALGGHGFILLRAVCHYPGEGGWMNSTLAGILMILPAAMCLPLLILFITSAVFSARRENKERTAALVAAFVAAAQQEAEGDSSFTKELNEGTLDQSQGHLNNPQE
jgi:hypothetical protein